MIRARFFVEKKKCDGDYRPLIWPIQYPYWCTGENDIFFILVAYVNDMNDIKLSLCQIEKMKHAIGFSREKIKRNRYNAYRNRFVASNSDKDWEELVSIGYAEKREFEIEKQIGYYVSELGMKYLGVLFGCIIIESK